MKATYRQNQEIDRAEWDQFVALSPQGTLYCLSAYLDIVAPGWSLVQLRDEKGILAAIPLHLKKKGGYAASVQPPFSQSWGVLLRPQAAGSPYNTYRDQNQQVKALLDAFPKVDWFAHGFSPAFEYPQPFFWQEFTLHTRYTWVIDLEKSETELLGAMRKTTRNLIRNTPGKIVEASSEKELLRLVRENRDSGKVLIDGTAEKMLGKISQWLLQTGLGWILEVENEGKIQAAGLFASFHGRTYYLMSAKTPGNERAMSPLLWHAILKAKKTSRIFDFEGSMLEGIEQFFRGFGPSPVPYLYIEKNQIPQLLRWIKNSL
ncbi:MAG: hypothetical protein H6581_09130 [Bacteroidia bacterium]|nr:hypothetical protein [Bacteroidia bacterium]